MGINDVYVTKEHNGKMVFNWMNLERDTKTQQIHPTQKPVPLLKRLVAY